MPGDLVSPALPQLLEGREEKRQHRDTSGLFLCTRIIRWKERQALEVFQRLVDRHAFHTASGAEHDRVAIGWRPISAFEEHRVAIHQLFPRPRLVEGGGCIEEFSQGCLRDLRYVQIALIRRRAKLHLESAKHVISKGECIRDLHANAQRIRDWTDRFGNLLAVHADAARLPGGPPAGRRMVNGAAQRIGHHVGGRVREHDLLADDDAVVGISPEDQVGSDGFLSGSSKLESRPAPVALPRFVAV